MYKALASEKVPVSLVSSVLLPTLGNPTKPTRASPTLFTSKPALIQYRARAREKVQFFVYAFKFLDTPDNSDQTDDHAMMEMSLNDVHAALGRA